MKDEDVKKALGAEVRVTFVDGGTAKGRLFQAQAEPDVRYRLERPAEEGEVVQRRQFEASEVASIERAETTVP